MEALTIIATDSAKSTCEMMLTRLPFLIVLIRIDPRRLLSTQLPRNKLIIFLQSVVVRFLLIFYSLHMIIFTQNPNDPKIPFFPFPTPTLLLIFFMGDVSDYSLYLLQSIIFSYKPAMSRDLTSIRSKLLDAFSPILSFQSATLPFQPKKQEKVQTQASRVSIHRQSYINLEEDFGSEELKSSGVNSLTFSGNRPKSQRKFLRVMSNPHELRASSARKSTTERSKIGGSCIVEKQKANCDPFARTLPTSNVTLNHQSLRNDQQVVNYPIRREERQHQSRSVCEERVDSRPSIQQKCSIADQRDSFQITEVSKINVLQQLISSSQVKPNKITKECYMQDPPIIQPRQQPITRITKSQSTNLTTHQHLQSSLPLKYSPPEVMNFPLNNGQPAFRTIITKQVINYSNPLNIHNRINLNHPPAHKIDRISERYNKFIGKENQPTLTTSSLRKQLVQQILQ